ncbi:fused MFS/spermidine synthase [Kibdelosporangium lantanae]
MRDLDRPNGWLLSVDGVAQSYVDLDDPTYLDFEYVRRMGDIVDGLPPGPLRALHVGGGACTLPRYVAATRPGSRQLVFDLDADLIDFVRDNLDLRAVPHLKVRIADGRDGLATRVDDSADLVVLDAFERAVMPGGLATLEFTQDVARVLRPGGTYVVNISDGPGLRFAKRVAATIAAVFPTVLLLADPAVLRGRRFGNLVLAAGEVPELPRQTTPFPARVVSGDALRSLIGKAAPITDASPALSPVPPATAFT